MVTRKPLSWLLYAAETANIRCRSGLAATTDRKASTSSTMQNRGRGKKKSWLNNEGIWVASTNPAILPKYCFDILETSHPIKGHATSCHIQIFVKGTGGTSQTGLRGDVDDNSVRVLCSDYFRVITTLWVFFRIG